MKSSRLFAHPLVISGNILWYLIALTLIGAGAATVTGLIAISAHYKAMSLNAAAACAQPPIGLVGWWSGDGNVNDIRGGNNGTLQGGATFAPGLVGQAFSFNGINQYVLIADNPALTPKDAITIEAWFTAAPTGQMQKLVSKFNAIEGCSDDSYDVGIDPTGQLSFQLETVSGDCTSDNNMRATPPTSVFDGAFHHIAATYDGSMMRLYFDGALIGSLAVRGPISAYPRPLTLGGTFLFGSPAYFHRGLLDEVSIYNRNLSASEIQAIFQAGSAGKCKVSSTCTTLPQGLVSWWAGDGNVNDIKNANSGTLQNGAGFSAGLVGQAFSFDGLNDYINIPDSASLDSITDAITVEGWIDPEVPNYMPYGASTNITRGTIFARREPGQSEGFSIFLDSDGKILINIRTTTSPTVEGTSYATINPVIQFNNQWQHFAATANPANGTLKLFVNGIEQSLIMVYLPANLSGQFVNVHTLYIGRREAESSEFGGALYYKGLIDELTLFDRELSLSEIQTIFQAGSVGKCKTTQSCLIGCSTTVPASGIAGVPIIFLSSVSLSSCPNGYTAIWVFGDGSSSSDALARHTYASPGIYPWQLTVTAPGGAPCVMGGNITIKENKADLAISMTVVLISAPPQVGATYKITITNNGPDTAASVKVTDNLPSSVTFVSCSATGNGVCGGSGNNRSVSFASLPANISETVTLTTTVNTLRANPIGISNTATVTATTSDPNLANNSATATTTGTKPAPPPSILEYLPASASQGTTLDFSITGDNFQPTSVLSFSGTGITVNSYSRRQSKHLVATITIADSAGTGLRDVIVTNPDGQQARRQSAFQVDPTTKLNIEMPPDGTQGEQTLKSLDLLLGLLPIVASERIKETTTPGPDVCYSGAVDAAAEVTKRDIIRLALNQLAAGVAAESLGAVTTGSQVGDFLLKTASYFITVSSSDNPSGTALVLGTEKSVGYLFPKAVDQYLASKIAGSVTAKVVKQFLTQDEVVTVEASGTNEKSHFFLSGLTPRTNIHITVFYNAFTHFAVAAIQSECELSDGLQKKTYLLRYEVDKRGVLVGTPVIIPIPN